MATPKPATIDAYIAGFPEEMQRALQQVRAAIRQVAPEATETISYAIPTFDVNGRHLVHFAAFKNHIGLYATPTGHEAFREAFSRYKVGKGSVQFPLSEPMPLGLIGEVVGFRMKEVVG